MIYGTGRDTSVGETPAVSLLWIAGLDLVRAMTMIGTYGAEEDDSGHVGCDGQSWL